MVAKGKAEGLKFDVTYVHKARRTPKAKKAAAKAPTVTSKAAPVKMSKADFVRARAHLSPKEIVEDAKAKGVKFDVSYVYRVRGYDKTVAKMISKPAVTNGTQPAVTATSLSSETLLKALGAEIGLGRAIELLQGERARVHSILRG